MSFSWFLNRLIKMQPKEVLYRVEHVIAKIIDKVRFRTTQPICPYESETKISPNIFNIHTLPSVQANKDRELSEIDIVHQANLFLTNYANVFGLKHNFGKSMNWHLDVKTGRCWPLKFWGEINIREGFKIGGPKFVWEINRLYRLNVLGYAYRLTGKDQYAQKIFMLLTQWLDANPYPKGVNWTSGIELSIRITNLVWALSFLINRPLSEKDTEVVNRFVWLHGKHLYRYPSKYSSNNNHAIAEAFALFLIGVYFPDFKESEKWLAYGRQTLNREVARQILPDGGSYEYSTSYLSFVYDFFLYYKLICQKNGIAFSSKVNERLKESCAYIYNMMDEAGNIANIGDQDSAVLVDYGIDNSENFKSILNSAAVLFKIPEVTRGANKDLKTNLLFSEQEELCENPVTDETMEKSQKIFKHSGISVMRDCMAGQKILFVGNATPLGMPPLYAHGHLDAASFWLSIAGKEIFVDPGTYLYHSGGKWRRYFRSTSAHNTVCIDHKDFTEQKGDFMFGSPYQITLHELEDKGDMIVWRVGHDAYKRLSSPVQFIREVTYDKLSKQFIISDKMMSKGCHLIEIFFHLHPKCSINIINNNVWITRDNLKLCLKIDSRLSVKSVRGSENPLLGWYSKEFNHIEETTTISGAGVFEDNITYSSRIEMT